MYSLNVHFKVTIEPKCFIAEVIENFLISLIYSGNKAEGWPYTQIAYLISHRNKSYALMSSDKLLKIILKVYTRMNNLKIHKKNSWYNYVH